MVKKRQVELDLLRILALIAVIMVHCTGIRTNNDVSVVYNRIVTFILATITWEVPVYVMISGRFFLDPGRPVNSKKIKKSIFRLVIAFCFWDVIYQLYYIVSGNYSGLNWKGIVNEFITGPYHLWYLFMCIGLYAITPFLRIFMKEKRLMEYFIILFFVGETFNYYGIMIPGIGNAIAEVFEKTNFHFALGFSGYYILGYYLYHYDVPKKMEISLYTAGIICLIGTGGLTVLRSIVDGTGGEWYCKYLMPNVIVEAVAIYVFFVKRVSKIRFSNYAKSCISKLSEYSFGVYLIHALVAELFIYTKIAVTCKNPLLMLLLITVAVFIVSSVTVHLIRMIPYIGKKIT